MSILIAVAMAICPAPPAIRLTCLSDGDSIVLNRTRVRLQDIDAPELHGRCEYETRLAIRARGRLLALLNEAPFTLVTEGKRDRYGRVLASLRSHGRDLGGVLVAEGLARKWDGRRRSWC